MLALDDADVLDAGVFRRGTVAVAGKHIVAVAFLGDERAALCRSASTAFDASGTWLIPGLVDAHTHSYGTLLRGTASRFPLELWSLFTIAYGAVYDERAVRAAVLLQAAERIRSGITALVDHFPPFRFAPAALQAHEASGLRVLLAGFLHDISDYDLMEIPLPASIASLGRLAPLDADAYAAAFGDLVTASRGGSGRIAPALGPNAPQRCSPRAWELWRVLRERHAVPVHTHLLETRAQAHVARARYPGGMIAAMDRFGLLDAQLSVAHAIWLTAAERELLASRGVTAVHNPASNLMLGSGVLPLAAYTKAGVTVALGTDSANCGGRHDLFEAMRLAMMLPRIATAAYATWPSASQILAMATSAFAPLLPGTPQGITAGAVADLAIIRRRGATAAMGVDTLDGFISHAGRESVEAVMCDGRWLLRDNEIVAFDEAQVLRDVGDAQREILARSHATIEQLTHAIDGVGVALAAATCG